MNAKNRAARFYGDPPVGAASPAPWRLTKGELDYLDALGIDLAKDYSRNLESFQLFMALRATRIA